MEASGDMCLLLDTLQPPTSITHASVGHFTGTDGRQQLLVSRQDSLEVYRVDDQDLLTLSSSHSLCDRVDAVIPLPCSSGNQQLLLITTSHRCVLLSCSPGGGSCPGPVFEEVAGAELVVTTQPLSGQKRLDGVCCSRAKAVTFRGEESAIVVVAAYCDFIHLIRVRASASQPGRMEVLVTALDLKQDPVLRARQSM